MPPPRTVAILTVTLLAATLATCGCGSGEPDPASSGGPATTHQAAFPLTITRMGGIAGFSDAVRVQDDGMVTATTKSGQTTCTIDSAALTTLTRAAAKISPTDTPSTPSPQGADQMSVVLSSGRGTLAIDEPRLAEAADTVNQILADVTVPQAQRTLCR